MSQHNADSAKSQETRIDFHFVRPLLATAGSSIMDLWDPRLKTFWRSTDHRTREEAKTKDGAFFPTVTFSSLDALLRLNFEHPNALTSDQRKVLFSDCIPSVLKKAGKNDLSSTLTPSDGKELNAFTRALSIASIARIAGQRGPLGAKEAAEAKTLLQISVPRLVKQVKGNVDGSELAEKHPFILHHVLRAFRACQTFAQLEPSNDQNQLVAAIHGELCRATERLLAREQVGLLSPTDCVALAFCGTALALDNLPEDRTYIVPAFRSAFHVQDSSGCWPLGRVVAEDKDINGSRLEMPTYEVAWAIADAVTHLGVNCREDLHGGGTAIFVERLILAGRYAERSLTQVTDARGPRRGWCSDHPYERPMIESWTSATVLQSLISLSDLLEEANRQSILSTFLTIDPRVTDWPKWLEWETFKTKSEPDSARPILDYIDRCIVRPILAHPRSLPEPEAESVSAVLFGPPGTSKTTIVKAVAHGLGWPIVLLSPGDFIAKGLEFIEAQAQSIFGRLKYLRRAVVMFDECDELFRSRRPMEESEQTRGITAFITASMLPKLQELHDSGRVVFFIATNLIDSLDPAIRRSGRIDHAIGVGPPDRNGRLMAIKEAIAGKPARPHLSDAGEELASATDRFIRKELNRAVDLLLRQPEWKSAEAAKAAAREIAASLQSALTIQDDEMKAFVSQQQRLSRPFLNDSRS